jgi:hypothetical protein
MPNIVYEYSSTVVSSTVSCECELPLPISPVVKLTSQCYHVETTCSIRSVDNRDRDGSLEEDVERKCTRQWRFCHPGRVKLDGRVNSLKIAELLVVV